MIIKKIKISNFRSYYNEVVIDFTSDADKNITLISGKNGYGKTSILTSLIWGFYGKLMSKVEEKYRLEIKNSGGYESYLRQQFNKNQSRKKKLSVEIALSDILIPSIPCDKIIIRRSFNLTTLKEELEILIDETHNELTKKIGYETFINDFILPREIAKFFFFDSEKIVSLAEAKTKEELKSLSKAYSEVLGLKKYEDLKSNLKSLISTLKKRCIALIDFEKLASLNEEKTKKEKELELSNDTLSDTSISIENLKSKSDSLQEKLIREGNSITLDEFKSIKKDYQSHSDQSKVIRKKLKEHLEFIPFIISDQLFNILIGQIKSEMKSKNSSLDINTRTRILEIFKDTISDVHGAKKSRYIKTFQEEVSKINRTKSVSFLLDFSDEVNRRILSVYDNVKNSFSKRYKFILEEEKENRFQMNKIQRKIKSFESKKSSPINEKLRIQKEEIDQEIENLLIKKGELTYSISESTKNLSNIKKRISEIENKQKVIGDDKKKILLTEKVLDRLSNITKRIKVDKKHLLEKSILNGLNSLMHKSNFIEKVNIELFENNMDIMLLDQNGNTIEKESMSKGEQQLYATSILNALVEVSGISFPIFVDSPLQKFDKEHSENIIKKFYPKISKQVVLFPLIEKELTRDEFKMMESNISSLYKIINEDGSSYIELVQEVNAFFV
ncbi:MAG: DNA sulfur modification protein DndD [Flavobacteriaceae bacterium]|nr:DNA sulfur modification protein DndD [Flavobacteriaceae bacterium]